MTVTRLGRLMFHYIHFMTYLQEHAKHNLLFHLFLLSYSILLKYWSFILTSYLCLIMFSCSYVCFCVH